MPTSHVNRTTLNNLKALQIEGEPNIIVELIDTFIVSAPQKINTAEQSLQQKDLKAMCLFGHTLKSSSQTMGAEQLGTLCLELENLKSSGSIEQAADLFLKIKAEYALVQEDLLSLKKEIDNKF